MINGSVPPIILWERAYTSCISPRLRPSGSVSGLKTPERVAVRSTATLSGVLILS
ncbi:hypothetical protein [Pseudanabaena sp. 'Roaring Creek']|uniref:hypothetical protein n=1 Tax=Pseudanabaena sp. 'Roaring Creek' TaxID=1681830 RepID=UPI000A3FF061|nr:hypothetical protein [Pseudanabaena sp. 'Roaring Creek']